MPTAADRVCDVVSGLTGRELAAEDMGSDLALLGLDSLQAIELVMRLEDEFKVTIPDEIAEQIVTPADAVEVVAAIGEGRPPKLAGRSRLRELGWALG